MNPTHPPIDLCIHILRLLKATDSLEFDIKRKEIPASFNLGGKKTSEFQDALNTTFNNFLKKEKEVNIRSVGHESQVPRPSIARSTL